MFTSSYELTNILQYLPPRDLVPFRLVSSAWNSSCLSNSIWKQFCNVYMWNDQYHFDSDQELDNSTNLFYYQLFRKLFYFPIMKSVKVYEEESSPTTVYHNPVEDIVMSLPNEFGKFVEKYEYCEELSRFAFISLLIGFLSGRNGRKLDYFNDTIRVGSKHKKEVDEMPLCCLFAIIQYLEPFDLILYTPNYFPNSNRFKFCNFESDINFELKSYGSEQFFMEVRDLYEMFPYKRHTNLSKFRNGEGALEFTKHWKELTIRVLYWRESFDD